MFSDPWGLCPPFSTDVSDCNLKTRLGRAWVALDGAGAEGRAVIQGIVDGDMWVTAATKLRCPSKHGCSGPKSNGLEQHWDIEVQYNDDAGGMAADIAHEYYHSTQPAALNGDDLTQNEVDAWDRSRVIYDNLKQPYQGQAARAYGNSFNAMRPGSKSRTDQIAIWKKEFAKEFEEK